MKHSPLLALPLCLMALPAPAYDLSEACDAAALHAAAAHGVPPQLMLAITRVETGRNRNGALQPWPWTVNQGGEGHWFDSPTEAADHVQSAIAAGQSNIDVGCFQLNLRWHGGRFVSLDLMFDPEKNADQAARFLVENHQRKGNWVDAVAAYHSATPEHAEAYVQKVEAVLTDLAAGDATATSVMAGSPAAVQENRFPLLRPGASGTMASLVPAGGTASPLFLAMR